MLANDFGYWLSGLFDGEGSFQIVPNRPGFICRANLGLRNDDSKILYEIADRTGLGRVVVQKRASSSSDCANRKPLAHWRVERKVECQALVAIFDEFRLRSKKARDFAIWREAVVLMAAMTGAVAVGQPRDWTEVARLKGALADVRRHPDDRRVPLVSGMEGGP